MPKRQSGASRNKINIFMDQKYQVMNEMEALAYWTQSKAGGGTRNLITETKCAPCGTRNWSKIHCWKLGAGVEFYLLLKRNIILKF